MKGSTHLAIGTAIGIAASIYYPFDPVHAAYYVAASAFSAISADLDGTNMLSSKLGKVSHRIRESALWLGLLALGAGGWLYSAGNPNYPALAAGGIGLVLLGLILKEGAVRNALVSLCGVGLLYAGWRSHSTGLIGLGVFVAWAPWLNHRGLTHTVWAALAWAFIAAAFERQLHVEGLGAAATAGYLSHLVADTLTPGGVKWLYPIVKKSIKLSF
ncbi:metal-dependent hydrolase [Cohnella thermotolerans]|uniref:metal-dependent hydrolase n=1 Tax=Cohnella thermotolerans TaxID=329858 RepID=UPI00040F9B68|nr:metal-dependent hydrolase [Cohnella thermotolerans]